MKRAAVFCAVWLAVVSAAFAGPDPPEALTLADCYRLALKRSEEIAVRAELIEETEARFLQARAGLLPKLFFHSTDKRQDSPAGGGNAFTRKSLPERRITLTQPLFSGFKEFAAMQGSKSERRLREQEKARAQQLLLVDVADAFHLLIQEREEIETLNAIRGALRERIRELKDREAIGRSRPSERVAAQARLYRVEAEWEQVQADERTASELLQFLTGLSAVGELADPGPSLPAPLSETAYEALAPLRPDVRAAEQTLAISRQQLQVTRVKFFPTAGAEGNYYVERSGAAEAVKWDASLKVDVPLFQGGEAVGANREAASVVRQAELRLEEARRKADREIQDDLARYTGAVAQARALTRALEAAEESYQMQVQEYRRSLVSNLEVLEALQILQDARRELIQALQQAHRFYWKLQSNSIETVESLAHPSAAP